jgi:ubiquinone/menaquinone biosynthesis C-methylase UbiE
VTSVSSSLTVIRGTDRRCRGWTLDNRFRRWWAPARNETEPLSLQPGLRVADLGAGVGFLTPSILERIGAAGDLVLVDPDPRSLAVVRARWGSDRRVHIIQASAADVSMLPDASKDRVILSLVLCCMVDKAGALDEAWRILRPGGLALVSYPERRWRLSARKMSLRVSPELWGQLVLAHPWRVVASQRHRLIRRHVIQKPESEPAPQREHSSSAG